MSNSDFPPPEHHDRELAVDWNANDEPQSIPITHFDFSSFDSIDACIRQELAEHGSARRIIKSLLERERTEAGAEGMSCVIALLWPKKRTYLALRQLAFAAGLSILGGRTGPQLAEDCGVSKQDFKQGADRFRKDLGLRRTRTMRQQEGCDKMKLTNFRHERHED